MLVSLLSFFCNFTFAVSLGMVALAVAAVMVAETPRELAVEATVRDKKKLNSGVRVRGFIKSTELVKFRLANFPKIKS